MGQYIDKAAVVAKIERLQNAHKDQLFRNLFTEEFIGGIEAASDQILSYINTLEVKEVDLEKETEHVKGDYEQADVAWSKYNNNIKYIDTEKLIAEIERLQQLNESYKRKWRWKFKWFYRTIIGRLEMLEGIKNFIKKMDAKNVELEVKGEYDCDDHNSWISFDDWIMSYAKVGQKIKALIIKD